MPDPGPIQRRKLSDSVQERMLELIRTTLAPGDPLPSERALMAEFGVGRPAVREALQSLQQMGLIVIRQGGRARVAEPSFGPVFDRMDAAVAHLLSTSATTLEHLKQARMLFEIDMVRLAAARRLPADLEALEALLDAQASAAPGSAEFLLRDGQFHTRIAMVSGNPIFAEISKAVFSWLARHHIDLVSWPQRESTTLAEHRLILDAIARGDEALSVRAMQDHLNRASALYRSPSVAPPTS